MKLKEYPLTFYSTLQLLLTSAKSLRTNTTTAHAPVIVSLTSIPSRLKVLHITIRSLLNQDTRPEKILLWLNHDLKSFIPKKLSKLENDLFEIRYEDMHCSHRKLIFALRDYPNKTIITCDDDLIYRRNWLDSLYKEHQRFPKDIIGNECRRIIYDEQNKTKPYKYWHGERHGASHRDTLAIGYGGTIYPASSLHQDVGQYELFNQLAPKADDLWFKAMGLLKNTQTRRNTKPSKKPIPIIQSQKVALGHENIKKDGNRVQWEQLQNYYSL